MKSNKSISVKEVYRGKKILIAGASGFLGKVFLTLLLEKIPEIDKLYILMRKRRLRNPRERFEQMINRSFVFYNLHERYGKNLSEFLASKVVMLEGDVSFSDLGLDDKTTKMLGKELDLFVNTAGLVDFNPDLRDAISVNVDGTLHCADFVKKCEKAKLLHVSTCFVSGQRNGEIQEEIVADLTPSGQRYDVKKEYEDISALIKKMNLAFEQEAQLAGQDALERKRKIRDLMIEEGMKRARALGWTNTYTYSKAMAEQLLKLNYPSLSNSISMFRPAIVESSYQFPFPGWNEGFNTCGPLAHLLGTWFRYLPAKVGNPFDVIPVDQVAIGMLLTGMELLRGTQKEVYQCSSSDLNLITIDQAAEFTSKSHQVFYKRNGRGFWQRVIRPWWSVKCINDSWHAFSDTNMRRYCGWLKKIFGALGMKSLQAKFERYEKKWAQIQGLLEIFQPFIHDYHQIYKTENLKNLDVAETDLRFDPTQWKWSTYWLDIHMPGLRRWCFPMIRREQVESLNPKHPFYWPNVAETSQTSEKVKIS